MGLNAAVYKKISRLLFTDEELTSINVASRTGQIDFENAALFKASGGA